MFWKHYCKNCHEYLLYNTNFKYCRPCQEIWLETQVLVNSLTGKRVSLFHEYVKYNILQKVNSKQLLEDFANDQKERFEKQIDEEIQVFEKLADMREPGDPLYQEEPSDNSIKIKIEVL